MKHPIPDAALDDRLAFTGTSGSGKTYTAKGCVETLLSLQHRVVIVDPLDVWFGLRLLADGKGQAYPVAILGGRHGDIPLTEHSGAIIGEAVARSTESCIVSLTGLRTSGARQRFMLAFLDALYERTDPDTRDPYHVVFDEADLWAPQKPMGQEAMLCHLMEEIVRRGRVKGFIPWLITQRPAVINKNVLSQVDGLIALKLTSSQDRDALEGWIEGQADRAQWKEIRAKLPTMERGQGVLWIPGRDILKTVSFPKNDTFDSSRTPKRGEKKAATDWRPMDLTALKQQLATVEVEAKANDPKALHARIADLERQLRDRPTLTSERVVEVSDPVEIDRAYRRGAVDMVDAIKPLLVAHGEHLATATDTATQAVEAAQRALSAMPLRAHLNGSLEAIIHKFQSGSPPSNAAFPASAGSSPNARRSESPSRVATPRPGKPSPEASGDGTLTPAQQSILDAIRWCESIGTRAPTRMMTAFLADSSPKSSTFERYVSKLRSGGYIDFPGDGLLGLTDHGRRIAVAPVRPLDHAAMMEYVGSKLTPAQMQIVRAAVSFYPTPVSRELLAKEAKMSAASSTFERYVSTLKSLGLISFPNKGQVVADARLFP